MSGMEFTIFRTDLVEVSPDLGRVVMREVGVVVTDTADEALDIAKTLRVRGPAVAPTRDPQDSMVH